MTDEIKKQIIIYLIEDDTSQRESIESLLAFKGYLVKSFRNANDFLKLNNIHRPSVLITDIHLPGQSGVDLHSELLKHSIDFPVIFISGESTIQQTINAMKQGAFEFLVKPFDINDLVIAIEKACNFELKRLSLNELIKRLSPREKEVYNYLIQGLNNNELMEKMNISTPTVKQYKSEVMRKLGINSLSQLIDLSH